MFERYREIFAYEISKKLKYINQKFYIPLEKTNINILYNNPVLITIRTELPLHKGLLNYFDNSKFGFISVFQKRNIYDKNKFNILYVQKYKIKH